MPSADSLNRQAAPAGACDEVDPTPADQQTVLVGLCNGVSWIPASQYDEYLRAIRAINYWVYCLVAPLYILLINFLAK
jgi:hypothetical protein